ncbi:MAG: nitrate reductase molybdenum cofactor assembly chaperone, partial [Stackebrandtia sp.]
ALVDLPDSRARDELLSFVEYALATPSAELSDQYVDAFDPQQRRSLQLTYYTDRDIDRREHCLARLNEVYAACGWSLDSKELPDHLTVVLDFAARGDADWGQRLLVQFLPGLQLLRTTLHERHRHYAAVLDAVCDTLPPPDRAVRDAARRIAEADLPAEAVGPGGYPSRTLPDMPMIGQSTGRDLSATGNRR